MDRGITCSRACQSDELACLRGPMRRGSLPIPQQNCHTRKPRLATPGTTSPARGCRATDLGGGCRHEIGGEIGKAPRGRALRSIRGCYFFELFRALMKSLSRPLFFSVTCHTASPKPWGTVSRFVEAGGHRAPHDWAYTPPAGARLQSGLPLSSEETAPAHRSTRAVVTAQRLCDVFVTKIVDRRRSSTSADLHRRVRGDLSTFLQHA